MKTIFDRPAPESTLAERLAIGEALVAGALANKAIQSYFGDPALRVVWTPEGQRRCPIVRVEYEDTTVISTIGEGLAAGRSKDWGEIEGVFPLAPDDPVHPCRILYIFKESNRYQARFEQRAAIRRRVGKPLVMEAFRSTRRDFLAKLSDTDVLLIRRRLGVDPITFWRAVRGRTRLDPPTQRGIFDGK